MCGPRASCTPSRGGLSHATPLGDGRARLTPGVVSPLTGGFPHISPTSGLRSRKTGGCVSPPPLGQRETRPCDSLSSWPWGLTPRCHKAWARRSYRGGEASGQSHKAVTASGDRGVWLSWRHPCRHREDDSVGRDRVLPASQVVRAPHPGVGRPYLTRLPALCHHSQADPTRAAFPTGNPVVSSKTPESSANTHTNNWCGRQRQAANTTQRSEAQHLLASLGGVRDCSAVPLRYAHRSPFLNPQGEPRKRAKNRCQTRATAAAGGMPKT